MSRLAVIFAVILGLGLAALAGPRLVVDPEVYDFGTVTAGIMVQAAFTLTNAGDAQLVFTRPPYTSCGCTSAPLEKMQLAPGESTTLTAYFDSTSYAGRKVRKFVYLFSNDPQQPRKTLTITGSVSKPYPYQGSASSLAWNFYVLVDLRQPEEYARAHLLGAVNIPFSELSQWLGKLPSRFTIYLYDDTGKLAAQAAKLLEKHGFLAARAIKGGLIGWWQDIGDAYIVWAPGVEHAPPSGQAFYDSSSVQPRTLAGTYRVIADFRPASEFASGHFPGAENVVLSALDRWEAALPPTTMGLQIWCVDDTGTVACSAASWLRSHGHPNSYCMIDGLKQWRLRYGDLALWPEEKAPTTP